MHASGASAQTPMTGDLEDLVERRRRDKDVRRITTLRPRWSRLGYYKGGVSEEALKAEQKRIEAERTQTQEWADAGEREVEVEDEDVMAALDDALLLLNETKSSTRCSPPTSAGSSTKPSSWRSPSATPTSSTHSARRCNQSARIGRRRSALRATLGAWHRLPIHFLCVSDVTG
jgi:hypothetical protein